MWECVLCVISHMSVHVSELSRATLWEYLTQLAHNGGTLFCKHCGGIQINAVGVLLLLEFVQIAFYSPNPHCCYGETSPV